MKILFINSVYEFGSTGRLVKEIMSNAKEKGHTVLCAYGRNYKNQSKDTFYFGSKLQSAFHLIMTRLFGRHGMHSYFATKKLIKKIKGFQPDVINLHNLHGYYLNVPILMDFLKTLDVKIVWTMHDTWTVSGSSAYFDYSGCKTWENGCVECNNTKEYPEVKLFPNQKRNFNWKNKKFTGFKNLEIITVSDWLKGLLESTFLNEYPITRIYNGIDLEKFFPKEKISERSVIELLGVANVWEARKGLNDFIQLSSRLGSGYNITLIGLSKEQINEIPDNINGIERTSSVEELVKYYQNSDIYLNLSVEETMGLTTVESLACGTPCIVYDRTAVPEILSEETGVVVEANNIDTLVDQIKKFDFSKYDSLKARERALYFSEEKMLAKYLELFENKVTLK